MFGAIFEVNSNIGKFRYFYGHFDGKNTVDFNEYHFFDKQFHNVVHAHENCVIFAQTV